MNSAASLNPFENSAPRAAYVHIPFCPQKCGYCDFYSFCASAEQIEAYVAALCLEISSTAETLVSLSGRGPLDSVYFGGGTPSLLSPVQLERLLLALDDTFGLSKNCEITLEANPDSSSYERFLAYRAAGVNRLSLGVQSLHDSALRRLGRLHDSRQALEALRVARKAGFIQLSADLMIGLPGQSLDELLDDMNLLLQMELPHFSFYALQIEEGTPFYQRYATEAAAGVSLRPADAHYAPLPTAEEERAMYHFCREYMLAEGYTHYEISNMARSGYECRHNQVYWRAEPYWGLGAAASSYVRGVRGSHPADFERYVRCFGQEQKTVGEPCVLLEEVVTRKAAMQEFFLLGLRLIAGVSSEKFAERFGERVPDFLTAKLAKLVSLGLLQNSAEGWRLSRRGLDFGNEVFAEFV